MPRKSSKTSGRKTLTQLGVANVWSACYPVRSFDVYSLEASRCYYVELARHDGKLHSIP